MDLFGHRHFHHTDSIADKVSALFQFAEEIVFYVSRPMRWDSDHVVILNDDLKELCAELVRSGNLNHCHVVLDFFDATLDRLGAYAIGRRATLKAFLLALLPCITCRQSSRNQKRPQAAPCYS
ncbi:MAG: L-rhamnose isomerase [Spirochaetaceae bacterium]|nr:MAG: L-rhamnose isomerase [Spirochaetaceae bacterium]